jgi:hypothetical protein
MRFLRERPLHHIAHAAITQASIEKYAAKEDKAIQNQLQMIVN